MADALILAEKSSNRISVALLDESELAVTDATVTMDLVDQNQEQVTGVAWPQTLSGVGGGVYEVVLPGALGIVRGQAYWARITSVSPSKGDHYQEVLALCRVIKT